jgi:hypothetical protein
MEPLFLIQVACGVTAAFVFYAIAARGLFRATGWQRLSLVELAADLLKSPDVPQVRKDLIRDCLDDVHSARSAWGVAAMMPVAFVISWFWHPSAELSAPLPGKLQNTFETFLRRWLIATIANSLLATIVCAVFALVISAFTSSLYPIELVMMRRHSHAPHSHAQLCGQSSYSLTPTMLCRTPRCDIQ